MSTARIGAAVRGHGRRCGAVLGTELGEDPAEMRVDGVQRDEQVLVSNANDRMLKADRASIRDAVLRGSTGYRLANGSGESIAEGAAAGTRRLATPARSMCA
jgi:hypothetical protein